MTDLLCSHAEYQLSEKKDHQILCWNEATEDSNDAKPKTLQRLDEFHDSTFKRSVIHCVLRFDLESFQRIYCN